MVDYIRRLGSGDFVHERERRDDAFVAFCQVLVAVAPRVLDSLRDDVLPLYSAACDEWARRQDAESASAAFDESLEAMASAAGFRFAYAPGARSKMHFGERMRFGLRASASSSSAAVQPCRPGSPKGEWPGYLFAEEAFSGLETEFKEGFLDWAQSWHLTTQRAVDWATRLLGTWDFRGYRLPEPVYFAGFFSKIILEDVVQPFVFEHEGWQPAASTRAEAEAAMLEAFKAQVKAHHDATEAAAAAVGGVVRTADYRSLLTHLEWLVRYHVLEEEWPDIVATATRELADGRRIPVTQQAVESGVKTVTDLLGLTLRAGRRPGRPTGSATVNTTRNRVTKGTSRS